MKLQKIYFLFNLLFMFLFLGNASAQVTVGLNETPEKYAILQIKDRLLLATDPLDAITADRGGLLLPRVALEKKTELLPFVTAEVVAANDAEYKKLKLLHTGLIVYNVVHKCPNN